MAGCCTDTEWVLARIDATKTMIIAYEDAIIALSSGAVQSYSLDTGQTRQTVTKASLNQLRVALGDLESRLAYYQNKLCGGATIYVRPRW